MIGPQGLIGAYERRKEASIRRLMLGPREIIIGLPGVKRPRGKKKGEELGDIQAEKATGEPGAPTIQEVLPGK